jgi:hypothetical protein
MDEFAVDFGSIECFPCPLCSNIGKAIVCTFLQWIEELSPAYCYVAHKPLPFYQKGRLKNNRFFDRQSARGLIFSSQFVVVVYFVPVGHNLLSFVFQRRKGYGRIVLIQREH